MGFYSLAKKILVFAKIYLFFIKKYDILINNSSYGDYKMAVSYKKLWKLLIDKGMKKEELRLAAGISTNTMAKLGKNENVNTEMLVKVCSALNCDIGDIMEIIDADK